MSIVYRFFTRCRNEGVVAAIKQVGRRVFRRSKDEQSLIFEKHTNYFAAKCGIEIGGPSKLFAKQCPVYSLVNSLDGCNFSTLTVWEGKLVHGSKYNYYPGKFGTQFINEASDLSHIPDNKYDFLLASHCLEHCANALATLREWRRIVKPGGVLLLVLPDRNHTFDHRRAVTSFEHLLTDEQNRVAESDLTHLEEILALHDLSLDRPAGSLEQFRTRSLANLENRCLHHHVFDIPLLMNVFDHLSVQTIDTAVAGVSQFILGKKI